MLLALPNDAVLDVHINKPAMVPVFPKATTATRFRNRYTVVLARHKFVLPPCCILRSAKEDKVVPPHNFDIQVH
jgi:hypothetical protein